MALTPQQSQLINAAIDMDLPTWQQNHPITTAADVDAFAQFFIQKWPPFSNDFNDIKDIVMTRLNIRPSVIAQQNHVPWFSNFRATHNMTCWDAYDAYMHTKGQSTIKIDTETDAIMDCLPQPGSTDFAYRGIVVGYVQSGKTSNYIGLINKAVDAGYKLIVVFSGMYNDLRRQTNERIDEGVIGRYTGLDTNQAQLWQQGSIPNVSKHRNGVIINNLTSSDIDGDVNVNYANRNPYNPNAITVAVCKKNTHTLDSLLQMLDQGCRDNNGYPFIDNVPLLVIDDEADNAGIDTNYDVDLTPQDQTTATAINKKIRCLLTLFKKSAYVGYTATPYANFLIDKQVKSGQDYNLTYQNGSSVSYLIGDGLFPEHFAICLASNRDYVGPEAIFGDDPLPIVRNYNELNVGATLNPANGGPIRTLPVDVKEAIHSYIIATAIRRIRGQRENHSSMLIHVDYKIQKMNDVAMLVSTYVDQIKQAYSVNVGANAYDTSMQQLYQNDFQNTSLQISANHKAKYGPSAINFPWNQIRTEIVNVLRKLEIKCVNSDDSPNNQFAGNLDYKLYENRTNPDNNGYYVIAVGGNCFSRGLTLEGLTTSFFYRNSTAYDTLMQMGRWFGYRSGYYDLCRIYLSQRIQNRFTSMTVADLHLRELIEKIMAMPNVQPKDFVMAIEIARGMRPTARNKQGSGTIASPAILEGLKQTTCMPITRNDRQSMYALVDGLFQNIGSPLPVGQELQRNKKHIWWTNVPSHPIIDFIRDFNNILSQSGCLQPNIIGLESFIASEVAKGNLTEWTVVLLNNNRSTYGQFVMPSASLSPINLTLRTKNNLNLNPNVFSRSKGITQGSDESLDYTDAELQSFFPTGNINDEKCRFNRPNTRGLLLIYPIIISDNDQNVRQQYQQYPLFGYAVSSPSGILTRVGTVIFN